MLDEDPPHDLILNKFPLSGPYLQIWSHSGLQDMNSGGYSSSHNNTQMLKGAGLGLKGTLLSVPVSWVLLGFSDQGPAPTGSQD